MRGNGRHYEEVSVELGGRRRQEGRSEDVFSAQMIGRPYAPVAPKTPLIFHSPSFDLIGALRCSDEAG